MSFSVFSHFVALTALLPHLHRVSRVRVYGYS